MSRRSRARYEDTGPVAMSERVSIGADTTAGELSDHLSRLGADLMVRALAALSRGVLKFTPQAEEGATYARKIDKNETRIDWSKPWGKNPFYYWYYTAQAMFQAGGAAWDQWNPRFATEAIRRPGIDQVQARGLQEGAQIVGVNHGIAHFGCEIRRRAGRQCRR